VETDDLTDAPKQATTDPHFTYFDEPCNLPLPIHLCRRHRKAFLRIVSETASPFAFLSVANC
jgi:hypothetical protein